MSIEQIKEMISRVRVLRVAFDNGNIPLEKREALQTKFVAAIVAAKLELPSSRLENNPKIHYMNVNAINANELIGKINEHVVVNVDAVQAEVYRLWKKRYELVHFPMVGTVAAMKAEYTDCADDLNFIYQVLGVK